MTRRRGRLARDRRWGAAPLLGLAAALGAGPARAQELPADVTDRCVRAAVKIIALDHDGNGATGTGSIIDPRGYVLTNFHVVGHIRPDGARVGTFVNGLNRVMLGTVDSARESARPRYVGRVVRGDARLDMALIRITGDASGAPLAAGQTFPTVAMADTRHLRPGSRVFAFGYPLGVRTINVTGGLVTGFQMNARSEVSWIRTDAKFNPGNSGGLLVDQQGRLVAIPTSVYKKDALEAVELARPVERLPAEWSAALRAGAIDDVRIDGVADLLPGVTLADQAIGDQSTLDSPEVRYYRLAPARPATVRVHPDLDVGLVTIGGDVIREGRGAVEVVPGDPPEAVALVMIPGGTEKVIPYSVRYEAAAGAVALAPPVPPRPQLAPPAPIGPALRLPTPFSPPVSAAGGVALRGSIVDAVNGRAVNGLLVIGKPGQDVASLMTRYVAGRLTEQQLGQQIIAAGRTDVNGRYEVRGIPRGQVYPVAAVGVGYRPAIISLEVTASDPATVEMRPLSVVQ